MAEEYVREWPRGCLGYANEQRRNATLLQPAVPTVQSEADRIVCSDRTLRRWKARVRREGHCDRRRRSNPPGGGSTTLPNPERPGAGRTREPL